MGFRAVDPFPKGRRAIFLVEYKLADEHVREGVYRHESRRRVHFLLADDLADENLNSHMAVTRSGNDPKVIELAAMVREALKWKRSEPKTPPNSLREVH